MIPLVVASERGAAQTIRTKWGQALRAGGVVGPPPLPLPAGQQLPISDLGEGPWKGPPETVKARYPKSPETAGGVPEYHATRESAWESGRPTSQG